jgi:hypothetical protein
MTQALSMHTTVPPPSAPQPAAGEWLCHDADFPLASYGASSGERDAGLVGVPNVPPKTELTGPLAHFTGSRSVKSP